MKDREVGAARSEAEALDGLPVLPPALAFVELAVFAIGVLLLDYFVPSFELSTIEPNPCWVPVLLLSMQYGTVSGLMAAAVSIGLTAWFGFPEQDVGENHFAYLLRIWGLPMLWTATALIVGQFRMSQLSEKQELRRSVALLSSQRAAAADYAVNLRRRCDTLEREVLARPAPRALSVLSAMAAIRDIPRERLPQALDGVLATLGLDVTGALYLAEPGGMHLLGEGEATPLRRRRHLHAEEPLVRALIRYRQPISVLTADGEHLLAGDGVVALPLLSSGDGSVIGMIKLDRAAPALLTIEGLRAMEAVADALAMALTAPTELTTLQRVAMPAPVSGSASLPRFEAADAPAAAPRLRIVSLSAAATPPADQPDERANDDPQSGSR